MRRKLANEVSPVSYDRETVDILVIAWDGLEPSTSPLWEARSNRLSYHAIGLIQQFGEGGIWTHGPVKDDSLAVNSVRPLRHLTSFIYKKLNVQKTSY